MKMGKLLASGLGLLACLYVFAPMASAQFKASLQGTVTDAKGGAVSGATVNITREDTGLTRNTVTSEEGFYRISELAPGRYTVSVEAVGFKTSISKQVSVEAE